MKGSGPRISRTNTIKQIDFKPTALVF